MQCHETCITAVLPCHLQVPAAAEQPQAPRAAASPAMAPTAFLKGLNEIEKGAFTDQSARMR